MCLPLVQGGLTWQCPGKQGAAHFATPQAQRNYNSSNQPALALKKASSPLNFDCHSPSQPSVICLRLHSFCYHKVSPITSIIMSCTSSPSRSSLGEQTIFAFRDLFVLPSDGTFCLSNPSCLRAQLTSSSNCRKNICCRCLSLWLHLSTWNWISHLQSSSEHWRLASSPRFMIKLQWRLTILPISHSRSPCEQCHCRRDCRLPR